MLVLFFGLLVVSPRVFLPAGESPGVPLVAGVEELLPVAHCAPSVYGLSGAVSSVVVSAEVWEFWSALLRCCVSSSVRIVSLVSSVCWASPASTSVFSAPSSVG